MRLLFFIGVLSILWLPLAIAIHVLFSHDPNMAGILTMVLLFGELLWLWQFWGKVVYQESKIFNSYGLERSKRNAREFIQGLATGFWFCLGLFIVEALLGWINIAAPSVGSLRIVVEGLLSAMGIAIAEELLFRGWLLNELQRDYGRTTCLRVGATLFAMAHFIKPIEEVVRTAVTFPALVLLGMTLISAKYRHGDRLGICIGIHGGLVWGYYIVNVGQLIEYTKRVPVWVTGVDGNPIAGIMGLVFLSGLLWLNSSGSGKLNY